jgi:hypothetical protein
MSRTASRGAPSQPRRGRRSRGEARAPPPRTNGKATTQARPQAPGLSLGRPRITAPAAAAIAFTLLFIAITVWWLTQDRRVPEWDPGRHLWFALRYHDDLAAGDLLSPLKEWPYPPFVHLVGAYATFLAGRGIWQQVLSENLVFVPLLALGCYQTAKLVFDDARAGLFAVLFALGTPMVVGQFHLFMLDAPQAAMAAVAVWLLLASHCFERTRIAGLAGVAVGLGMLTKVSFVAFVAGVVLVLLARGGWRRWQGLLAFAAGAVVVAGPWCLNHASELLGVYRVGGLQTPTGIFEYLNPPRFSGANATWYFWTGINYQYLAPLLAFAAVGVVVALVRVLRRRGSQPLLVELLVGGFVGWFAVTWQLPHDLRYSLPLLVYVAVLGAGWIVLLPRRAMAVVGSLLAVLALVNLLGGSFGSGHTLTVKLPGGPQESRIGVGRLAFYTDEGYAGGKPRRSDDLLGALKTLRARGTTQVQWEPGNAMAPTFNYDGLRALASIAQLDVNFVAPTQVPLDELFILTRPMKPGVRPCLRMYDGTGVWLRFGHPYSRPIKDACPR